jgi:hypothetical protein
VSKISKGAKVIYYKHVLDDTKRSKAVKHEKSTIIDCQI